MAWPSLTSGDVLSGKGAKTVGASLYARAREAIGGGTTYYFAAVTETGSSYADKAVMQVRIPESVRSGDLIQLTVRAYQSGGGVGNYLAREVDGPTVGTEQTLGSTAGAISTSVITVPDNTWAGATKQIAVQLKTNGTGTANADGLQLIGNLRFQTS
jgi:hypothetical protein